jgi:mevalonate kinase
LEKQAYYSNGKLMITGEYLVLEGAMALAVPTKAGQKMIIEKGDSTGILKWKSYYKGELWFHSDFSLPDINIQDTSEKNKALFLQKIIRKAHQKNPDVFESSDSIEISAVLGFHQEWGLGSSSSLINNLAQMFEINPYELFFETQSGSGYDIACAQSNGPIWYRLEQGKPIAAHVIFDPPFADKLAFVYSGQKQDSADSLRQYHNTKILVPENISRISQIGKAITLAQSLKEFNALMDEHEEIMSGVMALPKVKDQFFSDFPGSIKSLGAWGGDFILASSEMDFDKIKSYFDHKRAGPVFSFHEMILSK